MSRHRKSCRCSVLAASGLVLSTVLLAGCSETSGAASGEATWVSPTLVQSETTVFEQASSGGISTHTASASSSSSSDLTIWVVQGSEFSELAIEVLEAATGWSIDQQVVSATELQEALESLPVGQETTDAAGQPTQTGETTDSEVGVGTDIDAETGTATETATDTSTSTGAADSTGQAESTDLGEGAATRSSPDLILGMDENTLPTTSLLVREVEQYDTDYVCVLALREYFSANNLNVPASWEEVVASADTLGLGIVDSAVDSSSLAFEMALQNADLWSEVEPALSVLSAYPEFQLEIGLTGAPTVQDAVSNAASQPALRIDSISEAQTTNNLGTDSPLVMVPQTCVARPLYALAQTESGQNLLDFLESQTGQNLLELVLGADIPEGNLLVASE